ncbi:MAG TPA: TonB-dependent receptor [candidate division Zixibacteria bacterium]|nr:TonB-dependent receptor [candidate division Zixibacteria bacterium]
MRIIAFYILSFILILSTRVSSAELTGRVLNERTGTPIEDANVTVIETSRTVPTDHRGVYIIDKLDPGDYHVVVSHINYDHSDTLSVTVAALVTLDVELTPAPWVINDVVVTGTRSPHLLKEVPVQTEVIGRHDFERSGARSIDEALTSAIGIQINEDLSGQGATIRGIEGERVLVLIDGERVVGRVNGSLDLGQYSLTNVEKIEVVKGTGSTLYGSDAMGGVVNIITRKPQLARTNLNLYGDFGTHKGYNPSIAFEHGSDDFGLSVDAKLYHTDGFDLEPSTPHTNGVEKTTRFNLNSQARKVFSPKWSMTAAARFMRERKDWIEYEEIDELNKYSYDDVEINKRYEGSVAFNYLSGDNYSMNMRLFGTYYDHDFDKYYEQYWVDTSHTEDLFWEASYTSNYTLGQGHVATYGINYNYQDLRSPSLVDDTKADQTWAAYIQYEHTPFRRLTVLPGIRYEHHSSYGGHVNPSINIMYQASDQFKLRGFVGRGFRAPSIKQQYYVFDHLAAGYVVYGGLVPLPEELDFGGGNYQPLRQETSINSSISAEFSYGTIGLHRITYFYNDLKDLIEFQLIGFTPEYDRGVYIYQNVEAAVTQGIEWESRIRLTDGLEFSFSYDYLHTRDMVNHRELINRPAHTFKFNVSGFNKRTGIGASFWGDHHSSKLWNARSNTGGNEGDPDEYAPARTRLNANVYRRFGEGLELFARVENILDETEYEYGYWPGRELFVGFKYDFGNN